MGMRTDKRKAVQTAPSGWAIDYRPTKLLSRASDSATIVTLVKTRTPRFVFKWFLY